MALTAAETQLSRRLAQFQAALEAQAIVLSKYEDNQLQAAALKQQLSSANGTVDQARVDLAEAVDALAKAG